MTDADRARLFRRLLDLAMGEDPPPIIDEVLAHAHAACRASVACIELRDPAGASLLLRTAGTTAENLEEAICQAIADVVVATSAFESTVASTDPRYRDLESVRRNEIGAVLCAPLGIPPTGVLYVHRRANHEPFEREETEYLKTFAHVMTKFVVPQLVSDRPLSADAQAAEAIRIQTALRRHRGNKLAAARELRIDRSTLYRKLKNLGVD